MKAWFVFIKRFFYKNISVFSIIIFYKYLYTIYYASTSPPVAIKSELSTAINIDDNVITNIVDDKLINRITLPFLLFCICFCI